MKPCVHLHAKIYHQIELALLGVVGVVGVVGLLGLENFVDANRKKKHTATGTQMNPYAKRLDTPTSPSTPTTPTFPTTNLHHHQHRLKHFIDKGVPAGVIGVVRVVGVVGVV